MHCLTIGVSSRSLFDLSDSHKVYIEQGVEAFSEYQIANEERPLRPGPAFDLVRKLLNLNTPEHRLFEVVLISRNSHDTGLRVFNSVHHHGLDISRAAFCGGREPWRLAKAFNCMLYLSSDEQDVRQALVNGIAAAQLLPHHSTVDSDEVCIGFDGDAVVFSDEAEVVFATEGLDAFQHSETASARTPLAAGPLKQLLESLHSLQKCFEPGACPLKTVLVTARSAPGHERVVRTLRSWGIRLDESVFLGGLSKDDFLEALEVDIFFDDQKHNVEGMKQGVGAHVISGIKNN